MGWRVDQAYDDDGRARRRALPLRDRYAWRRIAVPVAIVLAALSLWLA